MGGSTVWGGVGQHRGGGCAIPKKPIWPLSFIVANITLRGFVENPLDFGILNLFAAASRGFRYRDWYFLQKLVFENIFSPGRRFWSLGWKIHQNTHTFFWPPPIISYEIRVSWFDSGADRQEIFWSRRWGGSQALKRINLDLKTAKHFLMFSSKKYIKMPAFFFDPPPLIAIKIGSPDLIPAQIDRKFSELEDWLGPGPWNGLNWR